MIGLDTNVLVRIFVKDDQEQARLVDALVRTLSAKEPGWIGVATVLEFVWVMKRVMRQDRAQIAAMLDILLEMDALMVERAELVETALERYRATRADFADCLIAASAQAAGCVRTVTFDRVAGRDAGMVLLEA